MDLTPLQTTFLTAFRQTPLADRFYLTGGTLLAARYLHHRRSLDLDFFTDKEFRLADIEHDVHTATAGAGATVTNITHIADRFTWTITGTGDQLKLDFVWYQFPALHRRTRWQGVLVDHLEDIAANKTFALFERREPKDAFDLYHILSNRRWGVTVPIRLMRRKFGLPITPQTFFAAAEVALKRLDALRGLLLTEVRTAQDDLFTVIHRYFDAEARRYLRRAFEE